MIKFNNKTLEEAVKEWLENPYDAQTKYGPIANWDVSNVENMEYLFCDAESFNQDIGKWDVSKVTEMSGMFQGAESFNQDIGLWNVSKVTDMSGVFCAAEAFNQDISNWNISSVKNILYLIDDVDDVYDNYIDDFDAIASNQASGLSKENKCLIHTTFSSHSNWRDDVYQNLWPYDWSVYCE